MGKPPSGNDTAPMKVDKIPKSILLTNKTKKHGATIVVATDKVDPERTNSC
jgi:hypothetical protein